MCLFLLTGVTYVKLLVSGAPLSLLLSVWPLTFFVHYRFASQAFAYKLQLSLLCNGWDRVELTLTLTLLNFQKGNLTIIKFLVGLYCSSKVWELRSLPGLPRWACAWCEAIIWHVIANFILRLCIWFSVFLFKLYLCFPLLHINLSSVIFYYKLFDPFLYYNKCVHIFNIRTFV